MGTKEISERAIFGLCLAVSTQDFIQNKENQIFSFNKFIRISSQTASSLV